jgi:hypothetical protein
VGLSRGLNPFQPDAEHGFRLKSNFDGVYPRVRVRTDAGGHRIPVAQQGDATGRFLFIGDSVTFGFSVPAGVAFPWRIAKARGNVADATVAAVPGYNLDQVLAAARAQITRQRPEWILYGLVVNDLTSSTRPLRYADIDPHAARAGGWLSGSYLISFIERRLTRIRLRFDPEDADEEANGKPGDPRDPINLPAESIEAFDRQWAALENLQREVDVPVLVLICPYRQQVEEGSNDGFQRFVQQRCAGSNLICLDPLQELRENADQGLYTGGSSYHFSERGHELVAQWLLPQLPGSGGSP